MKKFIGVLALVLLAQANVANACSYYIDEEKKSAELAQVAIASLGSDITVLSSSVSNFKFFESKPTPMCPEELTHSATVKVSYRGDINSCTVELSVRKVEPWTSNAEYTYTVSGKDTAVCRK